MQRWFLFVCLIAVPVAVHAEEWAIEEFAAPIDALSVRLGAASAGLEVSAKTRGGWTAWRTLSLENEQDPVLRESNLVLFPEPVTLLRFRGPRQGAGDFTVQPIRISRSPPSYALALRQDALMGHPRILSRRDWGASETLLFDGRGTTRSDLVGDGGAGGNGSGSGEVASRVLECETLQERYAEEYRTARRVTEDVRGRRYRWPLEYSREVKLVVVHHTALAVTGETRSGAERMRALYAYHGVNRGWGDIGYHFVIDETGQIYEGKAGGASVVGGHAYCNNTGTIGIALMGNFETEEPTQVQMQSLEWMLERLGKQYGIDLTRQVSFHGKTLPPIVGHRQLLSTDCPGTAVYTVLDQVRSNTIAGDFEKPITFPVLLRSPEPKTPERRIARAEGESARSVRKEGIFAVGGSEIQARPGEELALSVRFQAGSQARVRGSKIGAVQRSQGGILLFQERAGAFQRIADALILPSFLEVGESVALRLKVQLPPIPGSYRLTLGEEKFSFDLSGQRVRRPKFASTFQRYDAPAATYARQRRLERGALPDRSPTPTPPLRARLPRADQRISFVVPTISRAFGVVPRTAGASSTASDNARPETGAARESSQSRIRIRLGYGSDGKSEIQFASVHVPAGTTVNGVPVEAGVITLSLTGDGCEAREPDRTLASGILRLDPGSAVSTIDSWRRAHNRFRGVLECRLEGERLMLINELALEDYMRGLAEEPDSEPYEKQRAFAIAARSYAASYLHPSRRKFPGKPYDGSDSPAEFQAYGGAAFEERNPGWARAVSSTAGQVLFAGDEVLRAPYFTSDDGRTRSPEERGWKNFPHAEIFASKEDPWCAGMASRGHGVGMSGCGARGHAHKGKKAEDILQYYYPRTTIGVFRTVTPLPATPPAAAP